MFLINSCLDLVIATFLKKALLLPKLRSYFAEFLRESYLAPLSILYLPPVSVMVQAFFIYDIGAFLGSLTYTASTP